MQDATHTMPRAIFFAMLTALRRSAIVLLGRGGHLNGAGSQTKLIAEDSPNRTLITVPSGWKLVPLEMTPEMHKACKAALYQYFTAGSGDEFRPRSQRTERLASVKEKQQLRWKATLDAAPKPPHS